MQKNDKAPQGGQPEPAPQNKLALTLSAATETITSTLMTCSIEKLKALPAMQQTMQMAMGMGIMRAALTKDIVDALFMPLQGSRLGFRTDKDSGEGYTWQVVRDCMIDALIRGARPVGNELNIIAGGPYYTKEYFQRAVAEFPGLTDLSISTGVPHMAGAGALVPFHATWKLNGNQQSLSCDLMKVQDPSGVDRMVDLRIPVKVNNGQGADAILGKAIRKGLHKVHDRVNGSEWTVPEGDIETTGTLVSENATPSKLGARTQMDDLLSRVKPTAGVEGGTVVAEPNPNPIPDLETKTADAPLSDADKLRQELAEQDAKDREEARHK